VFAVTSALARVGEAARACLAAEVAGRAAVEQLDAVQRERDEAERRETEARAERDAALAAAARADGPRFRQALLDLYALAGGEQNPGSATSREIVDVVHATVRARLRSDADVDAARERDEALVRRDAAETAIRDLAEALGVTLGASPAETCVEIAKKTAADVALAKDLARLAQVETADRLEEKRTLRAALANLYERCGGTDVPADDADLISATADRVMLAIGPEVPVSIVREGAAERAIAELAELFNVESEDLAERIRVVQIRAESERSALNATVARRPAPSRNQAASTPARAATARPIRA
jgi:hypothetical protein